MEWMGCTLAWVPNCEPGSALDVAMFILVVITMLGVIGTLDVFENGEESWFYKLMMPNEEINTDKSDKE